jgi:hypothetical protein
LQREVAYDEIRLDITVVPPSGVFLKKSQKDFAIAACLPRNRIAFHARNIVDAAITKARYHYGAYRKAYNLHESVRSSAGKYTDLALTFGAIAEEKDVVDLTNVEIRRRSELEQAVRSKTGMPQRKLHPHPEGCRNEPPDDKDHHLAVLRETVRKPRNPHSPQEESVTIHPSKQTCRKRGVSWKYQFTLVIKGIPSPGSQNPVSLRNRLKPWR